MFCWEHQLDLEKLLLQVSCLCVQKKFVSNFLAKKKKKRACCHAFVQRNAAFESCLFGSSERLRKTTKEKMILAKCLLSQLSCKNV